MSKRTILRVALTLAVAAVFVAIYYRRSNLGPPSSSPALAPDFSFEWNGRSTRLAELRGQVIVLNFWATWCAPCVVEMPSLERLHRSVKDKGVVVVAISVDEDAQAYESFVRENGLTFATSRDPEQKISALYGTYKFPETFIIDRQGRIARKVIGPLEWDTPEVEQFILTLAK
jgi:peroxiredoxin